MMVNLKYGLKNSVLHHIDDVQSGLNCNCLCPSCNAVLIARKGNKNEHHFAHYNSEECPNAGETAIHLAAKDIIERKLILSIPKLTICNELTDYEDVKIINAQKLKIDQVILEKFIDSIKPDIIAFVQNRKLIIEVAVTHFTDKIKIDKIEKIGISAIEINLSNFKRDFNHKELEYEVLSNLKNRKWLYNSKSEVLLNQKLIKLKKKKERKRKELETLKKQREKEINLFKQKEKKARFNGYDILDANYESRFCPKICKDKASSMIRTKPIKLIIEGAFWNGKLYGRLGNRITAYFDSNEFEIFPEGSGSELTDEEISRKRKINGQLYHLSTSCDVEDEVCEKCKYFKGYVEVHSKKFACSFRYDTLRTF